MFISTQDYNISKGERCSSPYATQEERKMFFKNSLNKRRKIEIELEKMSIGEQSNLIIYMKCLYSKYVDQFI
jgi:hypothetical protein